MSLLCAVCALRLTRWVCLYARAAAENIATAQALKEQGNAHFKAGDYPQAIAAYHQIFMYVHGYSEKTGGG